MTSKMINYSSRDSSYRLDEKHGDGYSPDIANTLRSLEAEIRSCKEDNDTIIQSQEKQSEVNAFILHSLSDLQRQGPLRISHGQEDRTNGAFGSRSQSGHRSDRDDMVIDGRLLDTSNKRGIRHGLYSSFGLDRSHGHHHYHPYRRSDRGYLSDEFKKAKPPTFDGEMKNSWDA